MTDHKGKLLLVCTASPVDSGIQGGSAHRIGGSSANIIGVLCDKFSVLIPGHTENTGQDSKKGILVNRIQIITNLFSNVLHEVNTARDIIAEITFNPTFSPTNHNNTLFKGLGGRSGNVSLTVIVHNSTIKQTPHSNTGIACTVLTGKHIPDIRIANQRFTLPKFIRLQIRNPFHHVLESFRVKAFCIEFSIRHFDFILSSIIQVGHPGCQRDIDTVHHKTFWMCQLSCPHHPTRLHPL